MDFLSYKFKNLVELLVYIVVISKSNVSSTECTGGQVWYDCGSACTRTCTDRFPICIQSCVARCQCPRPLLFEDGECIDASLCPEPHFISTPENKHVMAGETVEFSCTIEHASSETVWYDPRGTDLTLDADVIVDDNRYEVTGTYNLQIQYTGLDDAGSYKCGLNYGGLSVQAELIVLESNPVCTSSIADNSIVSEGETARFNCEIIYRGKWAPIMTWLDDRDQVIDSIDLGTVNSIVKQEMVMTFESEDDGKVFKCLTGFNALDPGPGENEASNIPSYSHVIYIGPLAVHYPPRQPSISPNQSSLRVGDTLTCVARANPAVNTWQWVNLSHSTQEIFSTNQSITVEETWLAQIINIRCTVFNTMRDWKTGSHYADITFEVVSSSTKSYKESSSTKAKTLSSGVIAGATVATVFVAALIMSAVGYFIWKRRGALKTNNNNIDTGSIYEMPGPSYSTAPPHEKVYEELTDTYEEIPYYHVNKYPNGSAHAHTAADVDEKNNTVPEYIDAVSS